MRIRHAIETIRSELDDLEVELQLGHEELGRLRSELRALENSREVASLRFDQAQLMAELDEATQRLCAVDLTLKGLDEIRTRLEQGLQPATLTRAAEFLKRLTLGKYQRVWTPVGERRLVVDDEQRESLRVEQLSNGAREQLFLAIRMALIEQFEDQGAVLPVVLDDVVVNFDQMRTEAAVDTLMDFARGGRQVLLFTCHRHLAQLFESAGATRSGCRNHRCRLSGETWGEWVATVRWVSGASVSRDRSLWLAARGRSRLPRITQWEPRKSQRGLCPQPKWPTVFTKLAARRVEPTFVSEKPGFWTYAGFLNGTEGKQGSEESSLSCGIHESPDSRCRRPAELAPVALLRLLVACTTDS